MSAEYAVRSERSCSGSCRTASSVEPARSAKSTVTSLRSSAGLIGLLGLHSVEVVLAHPHPCGPPSRPVDGPAGRWGPWGPSLVGLPRVAQAPYAREHRMIPKPQRYGGAARPCDREQHPSVRTIGLAPGRRWTTVAHKPMYEWLTRSALGEWT